MSTRWTDAESVRRFNGFPLDENDPNYTVDSDLHYYIERAQNMALPDVSILVRDELCSGSIDASNTYFFTKNYPLVDQDFDKSVGTIDVTVYGWGSQSDYNTKTDLPVSAVDPLIGRVTLASAPSATYDVITCDYNYSLYEINYTLLDLATAYLAGFLFLNAQYMEMPMTTRIGAQSYRYKGSPEQKAWNSYLLTMSRLKKELIVSGKKAGTKLRTP